MAEDMNNQKERIERLSQELFGKPSKEIKYLMVTNYIHDTLVNEEEVTRTGLYQWLNVFDGEVKKPEDVSDYNDYDIVQVNLSGQDIHLVSDIKEKIVEGSNTKVVANNDYTSELWTNSFDFPSTMRREISSADMVFGTEYFQTSALSELLDRKVYIIPHPADVRRLKSLPKLPKKDVLSVVWRRYDNHAYVPSLVVRNHGLKTQLIGYDKGLDKKNYITTTLYDKVYSGTNYFDFCDFLRESKIVYDPFTLHSYSRTTVDTAALGVAVVGSNRTQSVNICYPYTKVDPYDVASARRLIEKLLTDEDFYNLVVETALEKVEFYNHTNSKDRYLIALYESIGGSIEDERCQI